MTATLENEPTKVPIPDGRSVTLPPGQPWPSAYRGSRYSLVTDPDFGDSVVLKWKQRDLSVFADPPEALREEMRRIGKKDGLGSFRITAQREVITKVSADRYLNIDQAPVSEGWVPAYLGKISGEPEFGTVNINPTSPPESIRIWRGFPFNHGERWSVSHNDKLIWKWRDYRFESTFDHPELIDKYHTYRPTPGRVYVTEYGHVWVNVPYNDVVEDSAREVQNAIKKWRRQAENNNNRSTLRLVNRRLVATSSSDDPADGHLPVHLGHLRDFDGAVIPRPVVDEEEYYLEVGQYEQVWE